MPTKTPWIYRIIMVATAILVCSAYMLARAFFTGVRPPAVFEVPNQFDGTMAALRGALIGGCFGLSCLVGFGLAPSIPRAPTLLAISGGSLGALVMLWISRTWRGQTCGFSTWFWWSFPIGLVVPWLAVLAGHGIERAMPIPAGVCKACGYQLAGASICPECGASAGER